MARERVVLTRWALIALVALGALALAGALADMMPKWELVAQWAVVVLLLGEAGWRSSPSLWRGPYKKKATAARGSMQEVQR